MAIWELDKDEARRLGETTFAAEGVRERHDLQRILRENLELIDPEVLVIAEEFGEWIDSRRRIDLLGVHRSGNLVVIELKRSEDGGHMELQALRYAAMISAMTFDRAIEVFRQHLRTLGRDEDAEAVLLEFLGWDEPNEEEFGVDVSIVLASAEFSRELTTSVLWLLERGLDIRCIRLKPYKLGEQLLLDVQQVIPLPEAAEYQVQLREKAEERRQARAGERDYTRYDLWVAGKEYRDLPKRRLVFHLVQAVIGAGATPQELLELLPHKGSRWACVDGHCETEREFLAKLDECRRPRGGAYDPRRFFTAGDELFRVGGRTYALSNQWGRKSLITARAIAAAYLTLEARIQESASSG